MKRSAILAACLCAAVAAPAAAKQCPAGQIFRVSKGVCMEKAAALKAGIVVASVARRAPVASPIKVPPPRPDAIGETVVAKTEAAPADIPPGPMPPHLMQAYARPEVSPFGALRLDYFTR